jgi:Galactose oxidase, central domain/IPT/TIG domain
MIRFTTIALTIALVITVSGCGGSGSGQSPQSPPSPTPPPPSPTGGLSISSLSPSSVPAGSPDFMLTITGTGFDGDGVIQSRVLWTSQGKETILTRTVTSTTQIAATVPAALLISSVTADVVVEEYDRIEGVVNAQSNSVKFTVASAAQDAASISPATETLGPQGARQFVFTIAGNNTNGLWAVEEGASGGTITSGGFYTAPKNAGTYHVSATAIADFSKSATATVSVVMSGFTFTGNMTTARSGHSATLLASGKVLIVGGGDDASAELFDPATEKFAPTGSLSTPRYGASANLLADGRVLIAGGFGTTAGPDGHLPRLSSAELYDPQTGNFSATGSMTVGRILHTATLLNDGRVLIAGGTDESGGGGAATASAELYDPVTGTFTTTGSMLSERAQHTATLLPSGEVLIAGGWNGHAADSADDPPWDPLFAELFDPSTGKFSYTGSMSTTRIGHTATRMSDGKVLMLGGIWALQNAQEQPPDPIYAELYDPATGAFSPVADVSLAQDSYTATLLKNGQVLIVGGEEANVAVASAELIDLANQSLTTTGSLGTARKGHTATRLNDGRVLVTGGTDRNGNALATAERYE